MEQSCGSGSYTLDEALELIASGWGWMQIICLCYAGGAWLGDAMEVRRRWSSAAR